MKLSEKGWRKLVVAENLLDDPDFEQSDFEGAVVLSIKEAKEIIGTYIGTHCEVVKQHGISELKIRNPNWIIHLLERIEQAEKDHENDD